MAGLIDSTMDELDTQLRDLRREVASSRRFDASSSLGPTTIRPPEMGGAARTRPPAGLVDPLPVIKSLDVTECGDQALMSPERA
jgi:hypothetical protein